MNEPTISRQNRRQERFLRQHAQRPRWVRRSWQSSPSIEEVLDEIMTFRCTMESMTHQNNICSQCSEAQAGEIHQHPFILAGDLHTARRQPLEQLSQRRSERTLKHRLMRNPSQSVHIIPLHKNSAKCKGLSHYERQLTRAILVTMATHPVDLKDRHPPNFVALQHCLQSARIM